MGFVAWRQQVLYSEEFAFSNDGQYTQVSMFLNTLGVPLDPGQTLDEDLDFRP